MEKTILKGAHISERKFRELVNLFSEDLTATQVSNITQLSRITINHYLKKIRENIAEYCVAESPYPHLHSQQWPDIFRYGILRGEHQCYTIPFVEENFSGEVLDFVAIADFKNWKLFRLPENISSNGRPMMDDISGFWGLAKNRLYKFRGLHKKSIYLHVKECEFRYNYRHQNLNDVLLKILLKN